MASTINADDGVVSGSAGVKTSADNSGVLELQSNGTTQFTLGSSSVVINEAGADVDFRVEGDTDPNLLFVDASTDRVGVGTNAPAQKLDVNGTSILRGNVVTTGAFIPGANVSVPTADAFIIRSADNTLQLGTASTARLTIDSSGNLGLGVTPSAWWSAIKTLQMSGNGFVGSASNYTYLGANFFYNSSANPVYVASAAASLFEQGAGAFKWYTAASGTAGNTITFTQPMTLSAAGNLGVGTTSPQSKLSVSNSGAECFEVIPGLSAGIDLVQTYNRSSSTYDSLRFDCADYRFTIGGSEKVRITSGGDLVVGATATINQSRLTVQKDIADNIAVFNNTSTSSPYGLQVRYTGATPNGTSNEFFAAYDNFPTVSLRFSVRSNGGIANFSANDVNLSDERVKTDIAPLGSMWDKFKAIEIVTFKYKDQTHDDDNIGVIAQQVESVAPEFVNVDGFGETPEDGVPLKSIYTADMYHAAIKALQEAMTRIEELEAKVIALESK